MVETQHHGPAFFLDDLCNYSHSWNQVLIYLFTAISHKSQN